jgi:hypothetical protein
MPQPIGPVGWGYLALRCAGALGAYARQPSEPGATYPDRAQSRQLAFAQGFFGPSEDGGSEILIFESRGSLAAADCILSFRS